MCLGQTTLSSEYTCPANNGTTVFTHVSSTYSHSVLNMQMNCSVSECQTGTHNCRSSQTLCFDYRTQNNVSYCAPAVDCSILEPCNGSCSSNLFVCVINSCCQPNARCLPLAFTTFCPSDSKIIAIM